MWRIIFTRVIFADFEVFWQIHKVLASYKSELILIQLVHLQWKTSFWPLYYQVRHKHYISGKSGNAKIIPREYNKTSPSAKINPHEISHYFIEHLRWLLLYMHLVSKVLVWLVFVCTLIFSICQWVYSIGYIDKNVLQLI